MGYNLHPFPSSSGTGPCPVCGQAVSASVHSSRLAESRPSATGLLDALLTDIVDNGAYNALGTGLVERLLEIKAAL